MTDRTLVNSESIAEYATSLLAQAMNFPGERLTRRTFRLPFLDINARFSSMSFARMCEDGLATRRADKEHVAKELKISVMSAGDNEWPAPATWQESSFSPVVFDRVITGHQLRGYYHHDHRFWQFYDPTSGQGVQSMLAADRYPAWESSGPLRAFLHWAYEGMGMRLAHAATVGIGGRGVLLAGSGGSGKSGTTLAGIANGMSSVGDDYVLLDREPSRKAHAVFATMKQDVRGFQRVKLNPDQFGGELNWQNKIEFDPTRIHPQSLTDSMEIVSILLPKIAHQARTTLEPARPAEAMLALAPSGLFQMPGCAASGVRFFSNFVRSLPVFQLCLSEDSQEIADTIRGFLNREVLARVG